MIPIDAALMDPNLLGSALGDPQSWKRWLSVLRGAFALPMDEKDRASFAEVSGDRAPPTRRVNELWCVLGRRSGKTRTAAAVAVYIGAIEEHKLAPGETGYVILIAASRAQAGVAFGYVLAFLESSPILRKQVEAVTVDEVRLKGNIVIGVHAGSYRTLRGKSLLAVVGDETSFWRDESSAQPDVEIFRACAPALAATNGLWVGISTGYRKIGLLFQKWKDHYGQDSDDVLVVQGASEQFNPTLNAATVARAKAADPEAADSEWGGLFRNDISAFLDDRTIDLAIDQDRPLELPPLPDQHNYYGYCDPSGGRHDAFTVSIAHKDGEHHVIDLVRGRLPPFDPHDVVKEYAALLGEYGITAIRGDNYSAAWVSSSFDDAGIKYERSDLPASGLYLESLPLFMRGVVAIPDHPRLIRELRLLERHASRTGKDIVNHGRNGHDDHANAIVGALRSIAAPAYMYDATMSWVGDSPELDAVILREKMLRAFGY